MKSKLEIIKKQLRAQLPFLKKDYHVQNIGIFGSLVKGIAKEDSDVDILVHFSTPPGFFRFIQLEDHLKHILKRNVDLVTRNALKKTVRNEILQEVSYV